jgi:hypothetical protein
MLALHNVFCQTTYIWDWLRLRLSPLEAIHGISASAEIYATLFYSLALIQCILALALIYIADVRGPSQVSPRLSLAPLSCSQSRAVLSQRIKINEGERRRYSCDNSRKGQKCLAESEKTGAVLTQWNTSLLSRRHSKFEHMHNMCVGATRWHLAFVIVLLHTLHNFGVTRSYLREK